jgi:uncharacterized membrane protein (UPF0182 family)
VANAVRSDQDVADALAQFNRSGNNVTYGNLLTVPVGDELMYVEPVYASLSSTSASTYPILRYVLVSYREGVGIANTLSQALSLAQQNAQSQNPTSEPSGTPTSPPSTSPSTSPSPSAEPGSVRQLLEQAEHEFALAQQAYDAGDLGGYQEHTNNARDLIQRAIGLENGGSPSSSPAPSGPSASPTP